MRLVIHIGTEKTGTSSIQESLFKNKSVLAEHGYYFSQCAGERNNLKYPLYCMSEQRGDPYFRNNNINNVDERRLFKADFEELFNREISSLNSNTHTVIISSEHFHSLLIDESEVKALERLLSKYFDEIKIVCYLREQVETCVSHYSTVIKNGSIPSFSNFMNKCNPSNPYYDYFGLLERWQNVFGHKSLIVSKFSRNTLIDSDIVKDFYTKINVDYINMDMQTHFESNRSLSYAGQCLLKELNAIQNLSKVSLNQAVNFVQNIYVGKGENVTASLYNELYDKFKDANRLLSNKYFSNDVDLFPRKPPSSTNTDNFSVDTLKQLIPLIEMLLKLKVDDKFANVCRDVAIEYEDKSLERAYKLMSLAHIIRPNGGFIRRKLREYEGLLK